RFDVTPAECPERGNTAVAVEDRVTPLLALDGHDDDRVALTVVAEILAQELVLLRGGWAVEQGLEQVGHELGELEPLALGGSGIRFRHGFSPEERGMGTVGLIRMGWAVDNLSAVVTTGREAAGGVPFAQGRRPGTCFLLPSSVPL